jgi:hypothetical protein
LLCDVGHLDRTPVPIRIACIGDGREVSKKRKRGKERNLIPAVWLVAWRSLDVLGFWLRMWPCGLAVWWAAGAPGLQRAAAAQPMARKPGRAPQWSTPAHWRMRMRGRAGSWPTSPRRDQSGQIKTLSLLQIAINFVTQILDIISKRSNKLN